MPVLALAALVLPGAAAQSAPQPTPAAQVAEAPPRSRSIGGPSLGRLEHGVALPLRGEGFVFESKRDEQARYGSAELVDAIVHAARALALRHAGSVVVVNDLSLPEGGPIAHHDSHQNGRDVDILFFLRDAEGRPVPSRAIPLDPRGQGWDFKDLGIAEDDEWVALDVPRTWAFIEALLARDAQRVQRIFLAEHLRSLLLEHARRSAAPESVRKAFEQVTCQPSSPHDDHMHVRFFCSPQDIAAGCLDARPVYPWRVEVLAGHGLSPRLQDDAAVRRAARQRKKLTVSRSEARKQAGKLHPDVEAFLDRREQWAKHPPRTGRPWCK